MQLSHRLHWGRVDRFGAMVSSLKAARLKPPDMAFGLIWTAIFTLCALSAWGAWQMSMSGAQKVRIVVLFALNGVLNVFWSYLYFQLHRPDWSLVELYGLWASVLLLILGLWRLSKTSSLMLLPYLIWVTAAGFLNAATVELNGPFG